ncbi:MAG: hypothetical protein PHY80_02105 [Rickettsiales bacterium]|nr:hypothetical protein [Rickettsiales bacterium]
MKNTSVEKKAENLKQLLKKPKILLKQVEVLERQIKTLQVRINLSTHKNLIRKKNTND